MGQKLNDVLVDCLLNKITISNKAGEAIIQNAVKNLQIDPKKIGKDDGIQLFFKIAFAVVVFSKQLLRQMIKFLFGFAKDSGVLPNVRRDIANHFFYIGTGIASKFTQVDFF